MSEYFFYILVSYTITFSILFLFLIINFQKLSKMKKEQSKISKNERAG